MPAANRPGEADEVPRWPSGDTAFIEAKRSELHATVAHGEALREELQRFFDQVV